MEMHQCMNDDAEVNCQQISIIENLHNFLHTVPPIIPVSCDLAYSESDKYTSVFYLTFSPESLKLQQFVSPHLKATILTEFILSCG